MHNYCYYAGSKDFGSTVINSLVHTFSLKIHWKLKNFVLFFGDVFLIIMELSVQVLPVFFSWGVVSSLCFWKGTWLQVWSEGILLMMAFPFRDVPQSWSILRLSFQISIADISLNIAHGALNQPPKWLQFHLDYDSGIQISLVC